MTEPHDRLSREFQHLDDTLAAAVTLPSVDAVIRRAGTLNRASTAAAAAVVTVGALGGLTAVAQVGAPHLTVVDAAVAPSLTDPTSSSVLTTAVPPAVAPADGSPTTTARPRVRSTTTITTTPRRRTTTVAPAPPPVVVPTTKPPTTTTPTVEGTPDPKPTTTKPTTTKPPNGPSGPGASATDPFTGGPDFN